ncbi:MAG TPA: hypothetical protein DEA08_24775, partial [Planctomycetes bacterium]|nr:hypothetical protein [Planctomycetota bacterium]
MQLGEPLFALEAATTARGVLDEVGGVEDALLFVELALLEARAASRLGQEPQALELLGELLEALDDLEAGDARLLLRVEALRLRGELLSEQGEPAEAERCCEEASERLRSREHERAYPARWAELEATRGRILARRRPEVARLAFAAARSRLEPALEGGRLDLLAPLFSLCRDELARLSTDPTAVAVRMGREVYLARRALGASEESASDLALSQWQELRALPAIQRA